MTPDRPTAGVARLATLVGPPGGNATDRDLLARFHHTRCDEAFAALVARHGPMVLGVCRRTLRDADAADDAFQATFLVLASKAGAVAWPDALGGWLHRAATLISRKARGRLAKRAAREQLATPPDPPARPPPADLDALQAVLDEELARLPDKLRAVMVLCHLEGLSHAAVGRQLGLTDGQLRGRLQRAKDKLRDRLLRRGFSPAAVLLAVAVGGPARAVPAALAASAVRLGVGGSGVTVPALVAEFTTLGVREMTSFGVWAVGAVVCAGGLTLGGLAVVAGQKDGPTVLPPTVEGPPAAVAGPKRVKGLQELDVILHRVVHATLQEVQPAARTVRYTLDGDGGATAVATVPAGVRVTFNDRPVELAALRPNMRLDLTYRGQETTLAGVNAHWPTVATAKRAVDPAAGTVTVEVAADGVPFDVALKMDPDAVILVDGLPAGLADVPTAGRVELQLGLDKTTVARLVADGDTTWLPATVVREGKGTRMRIDAGGPGFRRPVDLYFPFDPNMVVRVSGKDGTRADLVDGMRVRLRFGPDRATVVGVLAAPAGKDDD